MQKGIVRVEQFRVLGTDETLSLVHLSAEQGAKGATAQHRNKVPRR